MNLGGHKHSVHNTSLFLNITYTLKFLYSSILDFVIELSFMVDQVFSLLTLLLPSPLSSPNNFSFFG